jgi:hypothetical protein
LAIIVSHDLSEVLKILDPPVSKTGLSDFTELGSAEQIFALRIGWKPDCPVWQTGTSIFFPENQIFLDLLRNLTLATPNHLPLYSHF